MRSLIDGGDADLAAHVGQSVRSFRSSVGPVLGAAFEAFSAGRGLDFEKAPLANFTRTAQPVVHLPVWAALAARASGGAVPEGAAAAAVDAATFGYLCAQIQDDGIEGRLGPPGPWVLLAHALFAEHHAAMGRAAGPAGEILWSRYAERWTRYARGAALLGEPALARDVERDCARDRSGPLVLPAAVLLARSGQADRLEELEELVRFSTEAAQLFDDLRDARDDLAHGRMTYVVRRWGGDEGEKAMLARIYLEGGFDQVLDEALAALCRAERAAAALGMDTGAAFFRGSAASMEAARRRYIEALEEMISGAQLSSTKEV
ncbi:hypothetical protein [Sorangium sp. So ce117]|uniref:hypothetical protein n=1 Tax=Sorangium sp. So ce117 TaxID=3133277 RepID=UPI003F5EAF45